jgi:hypothetical protein
MTPLYEIQQKIKLIDYELTRQGFNADYEFEGKEKHLLCDPLQTAQLLQTIEWIEDIKTCDGELMLKISFDYMEKERTIWLDWNEYVIYSTISQFQALMLVATHEKEARCKQIYDFKNIPSIIKNAI